jgi:hypothetical protein
VRNTGFSGDRIDQALLTHVVADLSSTGSFDTSATSAIGSLTRLRGACRYAKERLSSTIATEVAADVPGYRGDIRLTRDELDDAIREPLDGFIAFFREALQSNDIRLEELAAIASVGGGASIPMVTTALSEQLGLLVITAPRPHLTAAVGAALRAARGPADGDTVVAPTAAASIADATTKSTVALGPTPAPPLAWSEAGDDSGIVPIRPGEYPEQAGSAGLTTASPPAGVDHAPRSSLTGATADAWYRRPVVVAVGTALAVLAIGAAVLITLRHTSGSTPNAPAPSISTAPATSAPANQNDTPGPTSNQPSSTGSDTGTPSSTTSAAPTTTTSSQAPTTTTTSPAPTTTEREPPAGPRFPRGPGGGREFPQPGPGYR